MIDITFLLLIFFLVAAKMDSSAAVDLPKAETGVAVVGKNAIVLIIREGSAELANVTAGDGTQFPTSDEDTQNEKITEYIRAQLDSAPPKDTVLIRAERLVKHREIGRVAKAIAEATEEDELQRLYIAVEEVH